MIRIGYFGTTTKSAVDSTAAKFVQSGPYQRFVITASCAVHLAHYSAAAFAADDTLAAGQDDFLLGANLYVEIGLLPGDVLSYVADADGSGDIFITPASQA